MSNLSPIPIEIDAQQIIRDLNARGWLDYKIEVACGLSGGYIRQIRCGGILLLSYQRAARLYNFWLEEMIAPPNRLREPIPQDARLSDADLLGKCRRLGGAAFLAKMTENNPASPAELTLASTLLINGDNNLGA